MTAARYQQYPKPLPAVPNRSGTSGTHFCYQPELLIVCRFRDLLVPLPPVAKPDSKSEASHAR